MQQHRNTVDEVADQETPEPAASSATLMKTDTFEGFFRANYRKLVAFTMALGASHEIADDVVAETMAVMYSKWSMLSEIRSPLAYAKKVAHRTLLAEWNRRHRRRELPTDQVPYDRPEPPVAADLEMMVKGAVAALPSAQQKIVALKLDGWDVQEIAELLGITRSTVRVHLMNARQRLHRELEPEPR
jgi:RNA polymerase sigma factor (sigma-70 family)